jgi:5'-nucleotidase
LETLSLNNNLTNGVENGSITISLLHFNDCYNIEPRALEPAGGAARFKTALQSFSSYDPIVLFSGDILGPSISKLSIRVICLFR